MDIFEGRLQSELIGEGTGELSVWLTFYNGLREVIGGQTLPTMSGLGKKKGSSSFFLFMSLREVTTCPLLLSTSNYWVGSAPKVIFCCEDINLFPSVKMA